MLGGRTNHWGRISLRFGPKDFKRKSIDGLGDDWPIGYDDVKPYYDKIDRLLGVFGSMEGLENDPDGIFLPPPRPRLHELMIKKAAGSVAFPLFLAVVDPYQTDQQRTRTMFLLLAMRPQL
jgi:choline dehydrogenase-like flavoprotein